MGAKIINNVSELISEKKQNNNLVVCEYLPGMEYTVDCFTDRCRKVRVVQIRDRERIRSGISVRSKLLQIDESVYKMAEGINSKMVFNGV